MKSAKIIILTIVAILALLSLTMPHQITTESSGIVSISNYSKVKAANGVPIARRGGIPIVSINYKDGLKIKCNEPAYSFDFTRKRIEQWVKNKTIEEAERIIREKAQANFEVWVDISNFPIDDPAIQEPPILLDNERIEKRQGRNWLVTTLAYFDIHLYNLDFYEDDFITRINSVDAGNITGDWWNQ